MMMWPFQFFGVVAVASCLGPPVKRFYRYDGWECAYRHCPGSAKTPAVVFIHPVGIGLSSWFWEPLMKAMGERTDAELFAVDLIGCGDSEAWRPSERGLFLPLDYSRQIEELWRREIRRECVVVSQGGCAPVAIQFATRQADDFDGPRAVRAVVLASPPSWREVAGGRGRDVVRRDYDLWSSRGGQLAYGVLRRKFFVDFFSRAFLFAGTPDEDWVERCVRGARVADSENPVFAFNAGVFSARGLYDELNDMGQPLLLLEGDRDAIRRPKRDDYLATVSNSHRATLKDTLNVLPWERPALTAKAISRFCGLEKKTTTTTNHLSHDGDDDDDMVFESHDGLVTTLL